MEEPFDISKIPFSEDFNDPTLYETLQWHMRYCDHCKFGMTGINVPPVFGAKDTRHCDEYYEIAQEYSDYERDYVAKGNP